MSGEAQFYYHLYCIVKRAGKKATVPSWPARISGKHRIRPSSSFYSGLIMMPTEYNRTKIAGSGRNYQMPMIISPFNNYIINLASSFLPFRIFDLLLPCQSVIGRKKESSLF